MTEADPKALAAWMKREREARGLSTTTLAKLARERANRDGVPIKLAQQLISNFEQGNAKRVPTWIKYVRAALQDDTTQMAPATLMLPVQLPNAQAMSEMLRGMIAAAGHPDIADELAQKLAQRLPARLSQLLSAGLVQESDDAPDPVEGARSPTRSRHASRQ